MGNSSEDVLLMVPHVRLKKNDGDFYLMNERLGWMMGSKSTFSVSHKYADIKIQKISPEGKAKVQLQVCLHDGSATTFQFVNPAGTAQQIKDRDSVKDTLQQLLPKFKKPVNRDLEEKNKLLSDNPQLLQLYVDLVISQVITAEEFWAEHAAPFITKAQDTGGAARQDVGVSSAFLADIKPQADGCNGLRYNLTSELMASIFRTYPSVKQKHLECVPAKMTESEFWTKFFHSHYFHRDRLNTDRKDLFTECARQDEQELKKDLATGIRDPLLDLTAITDTTEEEPTLVSASKGSNLAHQNMIRRFNQHSIMVLKASEQQREVAESDVVPQKRMRLLEATTYDDLESEEATPATQLSLSRVERYLNGPTAAASSASSSASSASHNGNGHAAPNAGAVRDAVLRWAGARAMDVVDSDTAAGVLGSLSPGGAMMRGAHHANATQLSAEMQKELRQMYSSLSEILRHFWATFPPTTPQLSEKATRMIETLARFNQVKLSPFEQKLARESTESEAVLRPLRQQLDAAIRKHSQWMDRRVPPRPAAAPM